MIICDIISAVRSAGVAERATSVAKAEMRSIYATSELASKVADALDKNLITHAGVAEWQTR